MTSKGLRLLAYGRVSDVKGREGDSFQSPDEQMRRIRAYAEAYDHKILEEALDLDVSGGVMQRPVLDRFLTQIREGKAQGLIVAKLDRFSRSSIGALAAIQEIEAAGGVLISVSEQIDSTTAAGRFLRAILFAAAEWERERIGESWVSAKSNAVGRGIHISAHAPPGYKRVKGQPLVPGDTADAITEAFRMAAAGQSYSAIATFLDSNGVPMIANRVKRLLANRVYLGEARSGSITNPSAHPPLTDEGTFLLAQRQPNVTQTQEKAQALLAGLVRCASCRRSMRTQKNGKGRVYRCPTTSIQGRCPAPSTVSAEPLESHVIESFLLRVGGMEISFEDFDEDETTREALRIVALAEKSYRAALLDTGLRDQVGETDHSAMVARLHQDWQDKLAAVPQRQSAVRDAMPLLEVLRDTANSGDLTKAQLRTLLAAHIQTVFVRPAASRNNKANVADRMRIVWRSEPSVDLPRRGIGSSYEAFVW